MSLFENFPLWAALFAVLFAQFIKVPVQFIATRKLDWSLMTSTGGMPSSHSAMVTALATGVAIESGLNSPLFALATVFAIVTMYDASGVRRQAGKHATVLNQLVFEFKNFVSEVKTMPQKPEEEVRKELKELLGHEPSEVFFGGLTGIFLTLAIHFLFRV
jgi:uncharacterized protein